MPSLQKIKMVENYKELLDNFKAIYVIDFTGFTVPEMTELRRRVKERKGLLKVGRNRLFKIALKEKNVNGLDDFLVGVSALLIAYEDPVEPLKVFYDYSKEKGKGVIKGGYVEGEVFGKDKVDFLAKLPSRDVLVQNLLSRIKGPVYGLVFVLSGLMRNLVFILNEIKNKKEGSNP